VTGSVSSITGKTAKAIALAVKNGFDLKIL
jgi:hypothetical protein